MDDCVPIGPEGDSDLQADVLINEEPVHQSRRAASSVDSMESLAKLEGGPNGLVGKAWETCPNRIEGFTGRELAKDGSHKNARAANHRLAAADTRIDFDLVVSFRQGCMT